jgi:hypothetical protein
MSVGSIPLTPAAEAIGLQGRRFGEPPKGLFSPIMATPFEWVEPVAIRPREWVYGWHYIRQFVSATVAPGGIGKTVLGIAEALSMATNRNLLGITPEEQVNVWIWNGEDPLEEMQRRVMAAALHYGIGPAELTGRLFLDSGRLMPIIIAHQTRAGTVINAPHVAAVKQTIAAHRIGVMIVDPFVASHQVTENDNGAINAVARQWAEIADETGCAIDLVHHSRKTNGAEVTVEDGRGAVALLSAARAARALNQMTKEEAEKYGFENHRLYFRYYDGKANLAPASDASTWFHLASVDLGNATQDRPSDKVAVVTRWEPPSPFDNVTSAHMYAVRERIAGGEWRDSEQSEQWVGHAVADVLGLDASDKADRTRIKGLISGWKASGALRIQMRKDGSRHERPFVVPGEFRGH